MRVGVDVVSLARLAAALERHPGLAERCFTALERAEAPRVASLAARFAAKEAVGKALGTGVVGWQRIETRRTASGAPEVWIDGARRADVALSLTHDAGVAIAVAVIGDAPA